MPNLSIGIACLLVFLGMAILMYTKRISALLALPIMALAIGLIGGIPGPELITDIVGKGSIKLTNAYTTTMFGAMLAELVSRLGLAKALIRFVAEFAGDNSFVLALVLTAVTALLFSTLGGLGAVIMVGTIVLPVMLSLGISQAAAGGLFLFGISLGGMFNLANWQLYVSVLKVPQETIISFVLPFSLVLAIVIVAFTAFELKQLGTAIILSLILGACGFFLTGSANQAITTGVNAQLLTPIAVGFFLLGCYALSRQTRNQTNVPGFALITPAIPLLLVLIGGWDIIAAFIAGLTFGVLSTWRRDSINILTRSIIDGVSTVIPAVVLMIGIGMLLTAVTHPAITAAISPALAQIVPTTALPFVVIFTIAAPLALYRGPLSLWGMGSGIVSLMQKSTSLSGPAIMGMLFSVGQLQGICDPTNTQNIWTATYLGIDTTAILKRTIPYAWLAAFLGLIVAVLKGFVPWQ